MKAVFTRAGKFLPKQRPGEYEFQYTRRLIQVKYKFSTIVGLFRCRTSFSTMEGLYRYTTRFITIAGFTGERTVRYDIDTTAECREVQCRRTVVQHR